MPDHRRPDQTLLLKEDILIIENLSGLGQLLERQFTFLEYRLGLDERHLFR